MKWKDHYKTLNIPFNTTVVEIKKTYRKLAHKYHPDKNTDQNKKTAERLFREITEAYKILTNPALKRDYDASYLKHYKRTVNHTVIKPKAHTGKSSVNSSAVNSKTHTKGAFHDFIKNTVFNAPGQEKTVTGTFKKHIRQQERGLNLKYQLNLTFEDACDGCEKIITFIRKRDGKNESAKLKIKVPVGAVRGKQMRLKGEGDQGSHGHCGDLLVVINILQHDIFKKKGTDVFLDLPITYAQAVIGGKVMIPTLRGTTHLTIPSGIASGTVLCIKKEGFKSIDQSMGDLFVNISIDVPKQLSPIAKLKLVEFDKTLERPLSEDFQRVLKKRKSA